MPFKNNNQQYPQTPTPSQSAAYLETYYLYAGSSASASDFGESESVIESEPFGDFTECHHNDSECNGHSMCRKPHVVEGMKNRYIKATKNIQTIEKIEKERELSKREKSQYKLDKTYVSTYEEMETAVKEEEAAKEKAKQQN